MKLYRAQLIPNWIRSEWRLCLSRLYFARGRAGFGGWTAKLTTSVIVEPRDAWVGVYWTKSHEEFFVYVCLVPFLPIRFHWIRSWGGVF